MAKVKSSYVCSQCGYETSKWNGKCPNCGEWNTFEEVEVTVRAGSGSRGASAVKDISSSIVNVTAVDASYNEVRYKTGLSELDRVLGGGLVKGSLVLLGGEPGIGKSTLLLQICAFLGKDHTILYVSGEESLRQIKLRADRLGVKSPNLYLLAETDCERICNVIVKHKLGAGLCDAGARVYEYVHAHGKVRGDTDVYRRARQQGRRYRRT